MSDSEEETTVKKRRNGKSSNEPVPAVSLQEKVEESEDSDGEGGEANRAAVHADDDEDSNEEEENEISEDEEDEEDVPQPRLKGKANRKRKRVTTKRRGKAKPRDGRSRFLDEEAAIGADEDEEDDVAADRESGDELTEREAERLRQESLYKPRQKTHFEDMLAQQSDQGIEEHYRAMARASASRTNDFLQDGAGRQSALTKQSLLPTPGVDTCMWRVRVKKNQEMPIVMALIDMSRKVTAKGQRVGITAAVWNGVKGHVLVEARNEADASAAVRAVARFVMSIRLEVVSYRFMPTSMAVSEKMAPNPIKDKQWVRFKRGLYKGDLARVLAILEGGSKVVIEMIPRLNYDEMATNPRSGNIYITSNSARWPQKFFSASEAREHGCPLQRSKQPGLNVPCDTVHNLHYLNGYLVKEVKPETLQTEDVNVSVEEVTRFGLGALAEEEGEGDHEARLEQAQQEAEKAQEVQRKVMRVFELHDTVQVISGELKGLVCKVEGSDPMTGTVAIRPLKKDLGLPEKVELGGNQLANYVSLGQHVKVLDGMFAGETGMVQAILEDGARDSVVSVLTDGENKEIRVKLGQVKESPEIATALSSVGGYQIHDMVQFGYQRFGVIIWLARDSVKVMDSSGMVQVVSLGELQGNRNVRSRGTVAYDSMNNKMKAGDQVSVTERGEHHQKRGTIKHVMQNTLWIHTRQEPRNTGLFVTRARSVVIQSLLRRDAVTFNAMNAAQATNGNAHSNFGGGGGGGFGGGRGGQGRVYGGRGRGGRGAVDPLVGKTAKVTGRSEYKGQTGTIRHVKDNIVFIDLESGTRPKTVRVDKASIAPDTRLPGAPSGPALADTPWYTGRTPMYGGMTPMAGSQTPALGSQTPALYGASTPALGSQTPRHGAQTPQLPGSRTPAYHGYQFT